MVDQLAKIDYKRKLLSSLLFLENTNENTFCVAILGGKQERKLSKVYKNVINIMSVFIVKGL